jgi:2,4-dienoyl-CoA reductase-like NADH-dependent reductase (Old Yellow Enzyme family)
MTDVPMPALFEPLSLRGLQLANRIMVSPMCQYSAVEGCASAWHYAHLLSMAGSGAGLLCLEATAVTREGRITPGCLGLWDDTCEAALAPIVRLIRTTSPIRLALQLGHAGRKASSRQPWEGGKLIPLADGGWLPEAPSPLAHGADEPPPRELARDELPRLREAFAAAARRAARLDFDALEVHMAHGYLLHQFLSPVANRRGDEYGGSAANRMRFPLEVFDAVRAAFPADRPVGVRVSATDWLDGEDSWTPEQTIELARQLQSRGCDWVDVSSGGISPRQKIAPAPGYQVPFAEAVRKATGMTTIAVGLITEPRQAEEIVAGGRADMVALGRAMLYDPRWPWHAAAALGGTVHGPRQYWRALPTSAGRIFGDISFGQR